MKKYIIIGLLAFLPIFAKAEVPSNTFFFLDNKGYDINGVQTYFCFQDGSCYTVDGIFGFKKEIDSLKGQVAGLQNQVTNLQNQLSQPSLATPTPVAPVIPVVVTPTPVQPVVQPTTPQVIEPVPYTVGAPSVYSEKYRLIRDGQTVGWKKVGDQYESTKLNDQIVSTQKTGEKAFLFSYDNINWFAGYDDNFHNPKSSIPYDTEVLEDFNSYGYNW